MGMDVRLKSLFFDVSHLVSQIERVARVSHNSSSEKRGQ